MTRIPFAANGVEVRAARDERDVFAGRGEPSADVAADRSRADDRDLHAGSIARGRTRARSGLSTKSASTAATRFMIAATTNTPCHPPADAPITLLSGTSSDATPLAV